MTKDGQNWGHLTAGENSSSPSCYMISFHSLPKCPVHGWADIHPEEGFFCMFLNDSDQHFQLRVPGTPRWVLWGLSSPQGLAFLKIKRSCWTWLWTTVAGKLKNMCMEFFFPLCISLGPLVSLPSASCRSVEMFLLTFVGALELPTVRSRKIRLKPLCLI